MNDEVFKVSKIIDLQEVDKIEKFLLNGGEIIDYEDCVSMSIEVYVRMFDLLSEHKVKEINTKNIKKVTKNYYYKEEWGKI